MDFSQAAMRQRGYGRYESLDPALLPPLHLIYRRAAAPGKDSGRVHSDVKQRWLAGDESVRWAAWEAGSLPGRLAWDRPAERALGRQRRGC